MPSKLDAEQSTLKTRFQCEKYLNLGSFNFSRAHVAVTIWGGGHPNCYSSSSGSWILDVVLDGKQLVLVCGYDGWCYHHTSSPHM